MIQPSVGDEIRPFGGGNVYRVQEFQGRNLLLKCVWFSEKEDTGDEIYCLREGQEIWQSMFIIQHWEIIPQPCKDSDQ